SLRSSMGLEGKKVILFVGRFTKVKRIDFLLETFSLLQAQHPEFHLLLVGTGGEKYVSGTEPNVTYFGSVSDPDKMAQIYIASDLFIFPGLVGLAPLTALCYSLPTLTIAADNHKPEFEYLTAENSLVLDASVTPQDYADSIANLFQKDSNKIQHLKDNAWNSIKHLTIDNMARNFINGVDQILDI
ncbi:MAG: glycosyltransferase family 4 protein, partial [Elainellaceae cyanobacterium]